jgi:hypothetical protein
VQDALLRLIEGVFDMQNAPLAYPVRFSVDRPDRELNRLTTFFLLAA